MNFFDDYDGSIPSPSRQAFSQARDKISYKLFEDFWRESSRLALEDEEALTYRGHRLFAIDGTSFCVGRLNKLSGTFGETTTVPGKAMCRISSVVDIENNEIVEAQVEKFSIGERALALRQVELLQNVKNALYLLDRGYWSPDLIKAVVHNGQKFLMRLPSNAIRTVSEGSATVRIGEEELRTYVLRLPNGSKEILLTNIPRDELTDEELARLYTKRWGIETKYLELKERLQIDKFSGASANTILQDIYCTLCISNLVAFICWEADQKIRQKDQG